MAPFIKKHRGAVTLIGAMFLIFVMIVLLSAIQRMTATEITDTALQNDSVEALFLAETGLERAAWRYSTGSACSVLVGESGSLGRGSFVIQAATLSGSLCHVRSQGSVVTTIAANTVVRIIEADLMTSTGSIRWATGKKDGGSANLNQWDGSSWSNVSSPAVPGKELKAIYCVNSNDCWAVGKRSGGAANINHWDGSSWSNVSAPSLPGEELASVHCASSSDCWAVGKRSGGAANINHWDGSSWSNVSAAAVPGKDLKSVYCVASADCWAVGKRSGGAANINHWDGSNWSNVSAAAIPSVELKGIHCISTSDCWAVGKRSGGAANINHWDGSNWSNVSVPALPDEELRSIFCVSVGDCWAVGKKKADGGKGSKAGGDILNINHWDGSSWTNLLVAGIPQKDYDSVYCIASNDCLAVGQRNGGSANIIQWDGSSWSSATVSSLPNKDLKAVTITGSGSGETGVATWTEVIF